mgnify:CR=1 FL=1
MVGAPRRGPRAAGREERAVDEPEAEDAVAREQDAQAARQRCDRVDDAVVVYPPGLLAVGRGPLSFLRHTFVNLKF